jgi:hypothetical protein
MMRLVVYRRLTWRQGAWVFGGAGLVSLVLAFYMMWELSVELRTWPRVEAHVDTADVATVRRVNGTTLYAARLRLSYSYQGRSYQTSATVRQEWNEYGLAAEEAIQATRAGQALVMLDPDRPASAVLREGSVAPASGVSLVFGVLGLVFVAFGIGALRRGRREGLDRLSPSSVPAAPRFATTLLAGMGVLWIIGAVIGSVIGQRKSWTPMQGQVERADIVEISRGMYAVRTWYTYEVNGQTFRAPVTANTSRPFAAARRLADDAERDRTTALLVDPSNPYRVASAQTTHMEGIVIPTVFGLVGTVLIAIALLIRRQSMGRRRVTRERPSPTGPAQESHR